MNNNFCASCAIAAVIALPLLVASGEEGVFFAALLLAEFVLAYWAREEVLKRRRWAKEDKVLAEFRKENDAKIKAAMKMVAQADDAALLEMLVELQINLKLDNVEITSHYVTNHGTGRREPIVMVDNDLHGGWTKMCMLGILKEEKQPGVIEFIRSRMLDELISDLRRPDAIVAS